MNAVCAGAHAVVLLAFALLAISPNPARATDPVTALGYAEATASEASADIIELRDALEAQRIAYGAAADRAATAEARADAVASRTAAFRERADARKQAAQDEISAAKAKLQQEEDRHDEDVAGGVAVLVAAGLVALLALAWGWFRASAAVASLTDLRRSQAIGLTIGGGLILLIVGVQVYERGGVSTSIGATLALLGVVLPIVFLLARHSAEIQRGRSTPLFNRERMPRWVTTSTAALFSVMALLGLVGALAAGDPDPPMMETSLRAVAQGAFDADEHERLAQLEGRERALAARASRLEHRRKIAHRPVARTKAQLRRAQRQLASAEADVAVYGKRVAVLEARKARRAAQAVRLIPETPPEEEAGDCHPSYSGCLDPTASDYDCEGGGGDGPSYTGTVTVIGPDEYGLDSDGDGIGCES